MRTTNKAESLLLAVTSKIATDSLDAKVKFMQYVQKKKAMFSPRELDRIASDTDEFNHIVIEGWLDALEARPRHNLIVVFLPRVSTWERVLGFIGVGERVTLTQLMKSIDDDFPEPEQCCGASKNGLDPATHRFLQWNSCQDSIYNFITSAANVSGIWFFDGDKINVEDALLSLGLRATKQVIEQEELRST